MCTTVNEWIASLLKGRAKNLEAGIRQLLDGQPMTQNGPTTEFHTQFYAHPVVTGMMKGSGHPSYLAARSFATTVMDMVTPAVPGTITFQALEAGIAALPMGDVRKALLAVIQTAGGNLDRAQAGIEQWFDDTMDRVSGWYKRKNQLWTILIAVGLTVAANADTLSIARRLWTNPALSNQVVAAAKDAARQLPHVEYQDNNPKKPVPVAAKSQLPAQTQAVLGELIGWKAGATFPPADLEIWIGWLLTAIAVSLGSPFWFDTLGRLSNLRGAGKTPKKSSAAQ